METQTERKCWLIKEIAFIQKYWMESSDPERIDRREKYGMGDLQQEYRNELRRIDG